MANDGWESRAGGILALAEWLRGQPEAAGRVLSSGIPQWRAAAERHLAVPACHHLGQVQRPRGRLHAATGLTGGRWKSPQRPTTRRCRARHRVRGLARPLTARDPRARRDQRIAGELVVTPGTVKKHVSHPLGKLGAASRTEAVTRARQLA